MGTSEQVEIKQLAESARSDFEIGDEVVKVVHATRNMNALLCRAQEVTVTNVTVVLLDYPLSAGACSVVVSALLGGGHQSVAFSQWALREGSDVIATVSAAMPSTDKQSALVAHFLALERMRRRLGVSRGEYEYTIVSKAGCGSDHVKRELDEAMPGVWSGVSVKVPEHRFSAPYDSSRFTDKHRVFGRPREPLLVRYVATAERFYHGA